MNMTLRHEALDVSSPMDKSGAAWLALLLSPLATSSIVLRVAIYSGLTFHVAAWLLLVTSALVACTLIVLFRSFLINPILILVDEGTGRASCTIIIAACILVCVVVSCLHRPDADDVIYLPKIIHYLAHPGSTMDGTIYELAGTPPVGFPLAAAPFYPTSYEFAQAAFAHLTGSDFFLIYYAIAPMMIGLLGVLTLIYGLRLLGSSGDAAACAVLLMLPLILLTGETHRSLGNVTLLRLFQSKFAFLWFGLPVFFDLTIAYLRSNAWMIWCCLVIAVIALGGMTSSALIMLPIMAVLLAAAWQLIWIGRKWCIKESFFYGLSLLPVIGFALDFRRFAPARIGYGSQVNAGFPQNFFDQFRLVYGVGALPTTLIILGLALFVCLCKPKRNAFILAVVSLAFLIFLNPIAAPWIMRYLTTENIYWRLFYLLPVLQLVGLACVQLIEKVKTVELRPWLSLGFCAVLLGALSVFPTSTLRSANGVRVGFPGPTFDALTDDAKKMLTVIPAGVVAAPIAVAQDMAILSPDHVQVATRADFMANAFQLDQREYLTRLSAAQYLAGEGGSADDLVRVMHEEKPRTIVIAKNAAKPSALQIISSAGFRWVGQIQAWDIYVQ